MTSLVTKHIVSSTGERQKLLVDGCSGVPLFYPNLYITSQIRGSAKSVATIQSFITSMKVLYSWSAEYSVDIEGRWKRAEWLKIWEVDSLRDFCSLALRQALARKGKVVNIKQGRPVASNVNSPTKYVRMTFIADYLRWLAEVLNKEPGKGRRIEIDEMCKSIKSHRPKKKGRSDASREDKGLDPGLLQEVMEVSKPGHERNPYHGYSLQVRNAAIMALLHFLGIRRGELLNLRVDDIDFIANELRVIRRADSSVDSRIYQPLVKTEERILPISNRLAEILSEYVTELRSVFPRARKHPYFFVTHKPGPYQGEPLSNSGFGKLMSAMQGVAEEFSLVHAHAFRHSWNYRFSKALDEAGDAHSPEREEKMRSYLMGWKETSGTAATYNRRHIKEKAKEAILMYQRGIGRSGVASDE
ncbi:tyrosine-type recombinase/integrase [Spongiibacter marinus]|uniref:tyrosine-type recombinase/integrase n=1 Tax=Spongiibacter marinus TaxID=354246 RepID=UPI003568067D